MTTPSALPAACFALALACAVAVGCARGPAWIQLSGPAVHWTAPLDSSVFWLWPADSVAVFHRGRAWTVYNDNHTVFRPGMTTRIVEDIPDPARPDTHAVVWGLSDTFWVAQDSLTFRLKIVNHTRAALAPQVLILPDSLAREAAR
jgi:hypothetical protein